MQLAFQLGRQSELVEAELRAVLPGFGVTGTLTILAAPWAILKTDAPSRYEELLILARRLQPRLGGIVRIALLDDQTVSGTALAEKLVGLLQKPDTTWDYGISVWGRVGVHKLPLVIKKLAKKTGRKVRVVLPTEGEALSVAQVRRNRLGPEGGKGQELLVIEDMGKYWVGETLTTQDIDWYSERDFSIPKPDSVSGMLPPKLAQTMLNLAIGDQDVTQLAVYDPFCGNGRVLSEALLMGMAVYGSDIVATKVSESTENLAWLRTKRENLPDSTVWSADARDAQTKVKVEGLRGRYQLLIVTEPYLGRPLRAPLRTEEEMPWLEQLTSLYLDFLKVWQKAGAEQVIVMIFPEAATTSGRPLSLYAHLIDRVKAMGYTSQVLGEYRRPDSLVSRLIVRLQPGKGSSSH